MHNDWRISYLSELPTGYRRLYSIVLDLAYRAYILNGAKESSGIVLVDEIDLHLHPSLEQAVVNALRSIFPQLQLIFTTDSAAVVTNLDTVKNYSMQGDEMHSDFSYETPVAENKLLFMQEGQKEAEQLLGVFGLDYNAVLRDFMETPPSETKPL